MQAIRKSPIGEPRLFGEIGEFLGHRMPGGGSSWLAQEEKQKHAAASEPFFNKVINGVWNFFNKPGRESNSSPERKERKRPGNG